MALGYLATTVLNPGTFTNPANANDRNDATSATKAVAANGNQTVSASLQTKDYSGSGLGTVARVFAIRVKHSASTSGTLLAKFFSTSVTYSVNGGSTFNATSIGHSATDSALTFNTDETFFVTTAADVSQLVVDANAAVVSSGVGTGTLTYTLTSIEIIPLFASVGSMLGIM